MNCCDANGARTQGPNCAGRTAMTPKELNVLDAVAQHNSSETISTVLGLTNDTTRRILMRMARAGHIIRDWAGNAGYTYKLPPTPPVIVGSIRTVWMTPDGRAPQGVTQ